MVPLRTVKLVACRRSLPTADSGPDVAGHDAVIEGRAERGEIEVQRLGLAGPGDGFHDQADGLARPRLEVGHGGDAALHVPGFAGAEHPARGGVHDGERQADAVIAAGRGDGGGVRVHAGRDEDRVGDDPLQAAEFLQAQHLLAEQPAGVGRDLGGGSAFQVPAGNVAAAALLEAPVADGQRKRVGVDDLMASEIEHDVGRIDDEGRAGDTDVDLQPVGGLRLIEDERAVAAPR